MLVKKYIIDNINSLIPKLSEEELDHLYSQIKDILKLPRTTKLLSNEINLYLYPYITLIDTEDKNSFKYINELNLNYKKEIKQYLIDNTTNIIEKLLNLKNNTVLFNNEGDETLLKIEYVNKLDGNYFIINLNKMELNNIEHKNNDKQNKRIGELVNKYKSETDNTNKIEIYNKLFDILIVLFDDNHIKLPKFLKKKETKNNMIDEVISKIADINIELLIDCRFRRAELYAIKDILEDNENEVFKFETDKNKYQIKFILKKIS